MKPPVHREPRDVVARTTAHIVSGVHIVGTSLTTLSQTVQAISSARPSTRGALLRQVMRTLLVNPVEAGRHTENRSECRPVGGRGQREEAIGASTAATATHRPSPLGLRVIGTSVAMSTAGQDGRCVPIGRSAALSPWTASVRCSFCAPETRLQVERRIRTSSFEAKRPADTATGPRGPRDGDQTDGCQTI